MSVDERLMRTAIINAAVGIFLALAACGVAALAIERGRWWLIPVDLILVAICALMAARNIRIYRILQQTRGCRVKGIR